MTHTILSFGDLAITAVDIFAQMGYGSTMPDAQTQRETQAVVDDVRCWLRPQFCYFVCRELPPFNMGGIIERQLRGSEAYACFVCTAGTEFEEWQQQLKSPGYCGWHVSEQQLLFPLFEGQTCGVRLTDSSLMVPIKSVSGIIGLGKEVRRLDYTCGLCDFKQCYKRRKK